MLCSPMDRTQITQNLLFSSDIPRALLPVCAPCRAALQYAVFGRMTRGEEVLMKMEELPTRKSGMFVMVRGNEMRCYIGG